MPASSWGRAYSAALKPITSLEGELEVCCEDGCSPSSQAPAALAAARGAQFLAVLSFLRKYSGAASHSHWASTTQRSRM